MPRIAATLALVLAITLVAATPAAAQDRDCSDNAGPGDPHRLDTDDDGRACDSNPCPCRGPDGDGGGGGGRPLVRDASKLSFESRVLGRHVTRTYAPDSLVIGSFLRRLSTHDVEGPRQPERTLPIRQEKQAGH
jgi:hypothetical protein